MQIKCRVLTNLPPLMEHMYTLTLYMFLLFIHFLFLCPHWPHCLKTPLTDIYLFIYLMSQKILYPNCTQHRNLNIIQRHNFSWKWQKKCHNNASFFFGCWTICQQMHRKCRFLTFYLTYVWHNPTITWALKTKKASSAVILRARFTDVMLVCYLGKFMSQNLGTPPPPPFTL